MDDVVKQSVTFDVEPLTSIPKCSSRCRELSGSLREPLRVLMDDVVELSVTIDVSEGTSKRTDG